MDTKAILDIAQQFIVTPQGLKFLEKIKVKEAKEVVAAIKKVNEERKDDNANLTAEERKNKRLEAVEVAKDKAKGIAGEEAAKFLPYLQIFNIKGRIYDYQTKEPIEGISVRPQLCAFPVTNNPLFQKRPNSSDNLAERLASSAIRFNVVTEEP